MTTPFDKEIDIAVEKFRTLITEQLERQLQMEEPEGGKYFSDMDRIVIGLVPGDGIGPIIMKSAEAVLKYLLKDELRSGRVILKHIDGLTIENRLSKGLAVPEDVLEEIKTCDVLLKGPTTTPKGGNLESANVALRRELDLYANIRPVVIPHKNIDWIFFRENTEGEYVLGSRGVEINDKLTMDFKVTTNAGTRRIARAAYEYARKNGKKRVSIVTKANIMKKTDGYFSEICHEVASEYPEIETDEWYIDIMTANLVDKKIRSDFQVFLLPNLYGDIITDEAAQIQGGVGTAGSANAGDSYAMFEAIHGSAPRLIEAGLGNYANPSSILVATAMLLDHISMKNMADKLKAALKICTGDDGKVKMTGDATGGTCKEFADNLLQVLKQM